MVKRKNVIQFPKTDEQKAAEARDKRWLDEQLERLDIYPGLVGKFMCNKCGEFFTHDADTPPSALEGGFPSGWLCMHWTVNYRGTSRSHTLSYCQACAPTVSEFLATTAHEALDLDRTGQV